MGKTTNEWNEIRNLQLKTLSTLKYHGIVCASTLFCIESRVRRRQVVFSVWMYSYLCLTRSRGTVWEIHTDSSRGLNCSHEWQCDSLVPTALSLLSPSPFLWLCTFSDFVWVTLLTWRRQRPSVKNISFWGSLPQHNNYIREKDEGKRVQETRGHEERVFTLFELKEVGN
jgi:hypothetical protein